jgi:hypothetical protein
LLGLDPNNLTVAHPTSEEQAQSTATVPPAAQTAAVQETEELIDCRPPEWQRAHDDDDECDMDPRTLAEAAARLAKYTSDEPVGNLPPQQWADLYKEAGPEDLSADTACEMLVWCAGPGKMVFRPTEWRLSCGAHKVRYILNPQSK